EAEQRADVDHHHGLEPSHRGGEDDQRRRRCARPIAFAHARPFFGFGVRAARERARRVDAAPVLLREPPEGAPRPGLRPEVAPPVSRLPAPGAAPTATAPLRRAAIALRKLATSLVLSTSPAVSPARRAANTP